MFGVFEKGTEPAETIWEDVRYPSSQLWIKPTAVKIIVIIYKLRIFFAKVFRFLAIFKSLFFINILAPSVLYVL